MRNRATITGILVAVLVALPGVASAGGGVSQTSTNNTTSGSAAAGNTGEISSSIQQNFEATKIPDPVPDVVAPALTTTLSETCMGSTSMGVSSFGFGISIGSTWRDEHCTRRLDARQIQALGYIEPAKELMCDDDAVRAAFARANMPCAARDEDTAEN